MQSAKAKFEQYIRQKEVNLGVIFSVLDTNSNKEIDIQEFKRKMRGLHTGLDEEEIVALFRSMDINNSQTISYNELVDSFQALNTA